MPLLAGDSRRCQGWPVRSIIGSVPMGSTGWLFRTKVAARVEACKQPDFRWVPVDHAARCGEKMQLHDPRSSSRARAKLAIFDVDKTFVHGDSFKWFCWFAMRANGIRLRWLWRFALDASMLLTGLVDAGRFKKSCLLLCLAKNDKATLTTLVENFVDSLLMKRVRSAAVDRLRWHQTQNHTIIFLSASPDLYLNDLGSRFAVDRLICTKFLNQDGKFTGELFSANCKGDEKRRRLLEVFPATEIAWDQSYGYGNSVEDVAFLELLGNAVAVNPDAKLRKIAVQRNWAIETWS